MATLRNLRAYVPGSNETSGVAVDAYDTGTNKGILRKINLNVDIATQNELNEAVNLLSAQITATGEGWKAADEALSGALKEWAKGEELSGALHTEITAETTRATTAEGELSNAINALTGTYASKLSVEAPYAVTVEKQTTAESGFASTYVVKQGGTAVDVKINIPKDFLVKSAELCTVTVAGQPYDGAKVGDKYIDFVVNTEDGSETAKHVYLPVNDLVDVYTGAETDTATVTVGADNSISVAVKDYVSKTYVDGVSSAISTAFEPRVAANEAVSQFVADMSATWGGGGTAIQSVAGDNVYLTATTDKNKNVTVAATADLCAAVENANSALQPNEIYGDSTTDLITTITSDHYVSIDPTDKLTAAVASAETALQTISKGTDGTYVTTTIGAKENNNQTVGVAVTVAALTAGTNGLAEATDVKQYVDGKITELSVSAAGDDYVTASSTGKAITVAAADRTKAAIDKVEGTSATWDAALQNVEGGSTTYATVSVSGKASNKQTISATVLTHTVADATAIADGLAVASDVKAYVDTVSAAIAVTATGDDYVSAWVENGKDVKLAAKAKLTDVVAAVKTSADTWNDALQSADIAEGATNGTIAVKGTDVAVHGLGSAAYTLSTAYDKAGDAAALQTAVIAAVNDARFASDAADDYADIDAIIADLIKVRKALGALKALSVTLTPAQA